MYILCFVRSTSSFELNFFENNDFSKTSAKLHIQKTVDFAITPHVYPPNIASYVPGIAISLSHHSFVFNSPVCRLCFTECSLTGLDNIAKIVASGFKVPASYEYLFHFRNERFSFIRAIVQISQPLWSFGRHRAEELFPRRFR